MTAYAPAGAGEAAQRLICAECRLIPTLDTVLMGKLLLEQVAETEPKS